MAGSRPRFKPRSFRLGHTPPKISSLSYVKDAMARGGKVAPMKNDQLRALGFFDARIPRYTSYPPATVFTSDVGAGFQTQCLSMLDPDVPVSVYVHIPFCERLCWFCACRTQGTQTLGPVERYLDVVKAELSLLRETLPKGARMGRLHWGGGTPTILQPEWIHQLAEDIRGVIPPDGDFEFSVEIDPTMVDADKIAALSEVGMTRASIGIQDFAEDVQQAIGRQQSFEQTRDCVDMLRDAGIHSLNADLVYGLPFQTLAKIDASIDKTLQLDPDRIALFGYAHVPHMSKRQNLIKDASLPDDETRHALSELAASKFKGAGMEAIGIDHFAKPDDRLAISARTGHLRRNFQGYTEDSCQTLIGVGASSISRFEQGYVQNASATAAYIQRIQEGALAGFRGHVHSPDDIMRARLVEMIMCDFKADLTELRDTFGTLTETLDTDHDAVCERFGDLIARTPEQLALRSDGRHLARLVANMYDHSKVALGMYSKAS